MVGIILVGLFLREMFFHTGLVHAAVYRSPFSVMYLAVIISALLGGMWAGLWAVAVCSIVIVWEFSWHHWTIAGDWPRLVLFLVVSVLVVQIGRRARRARIDADAASAQHRQSEEYIGGILDSLPEAFVLLDQDWRFLYVNHACELMYGMTRETLLGSTLWGSLPELTGSIAEPRYRQAMKERISVQFEMSCPRLKFWVECGAFPVAEGISIYVQNITERRRGEIERNDLLLREQKARAEAEAANRRKDQFLAVLSHELRTPLTPVLARLELMKREPNLGATFKNGLQMIRRNVELEARLIDDLLDITRLARGQLKLHPETIDAHDKIRAAVEIYQGDITARSQTIHLQLDAPDHFVLADGVRLQQVFWNLLGNAVKYTPEGGHITIRSSMESHNGHAALLRVRFRDNGIGIDPEVMRRLFDSFEQGEQTLTRRYGGLGLGLSISRNLIEMQGGTLTAESAGIGQGATFTVELPTVPAPVVSAVPEVLLKPEADSERSTATPSPATAVQRILLVDDNEDTLRVMARLLRLNGHQVVTADSVNTAIQAAGEPFDLLISDIGLPDGTGWELMRELRRRGPVRGIALSGFSMDEDIRRSHEVGFIEHLCKPIMPDELEQAILRAAGHSLT